jgi:alkanesulfonate monooxygenase SsuD/methylene tetrahydromethanopterin reductase-like flavin-dependent oxidoreductase (luciferase family)
MKENSLTKEVAKLSLLDLSPISEGSDARQSFINTIDLAKHAEALGYHRYWLAEHHGMPGVASAATSVLIGQVASATSRYAWAQAASCYLIILH